jgi:hypothetical protein
MLFYIKFQDVSHAYLLHLMSFDAILLGHNFEGLFDPGLGVQRYYECANDDLFWHFLELTVPAFDPTVPLQQPRWDPDVDIL